MAQYQTSQKTRIEQQIAKLEAQLSALDSAITGAMKKHKSYRLDSGEGSQQVTNNDVDRLVAAQERLQKRLDRLYNRLGGRGLVSMRVRGV